MGSCGFGVSGFRLFCCFGGFRAYKDALELRVLERARGDLMLLAF